MQPSEENRFLKFANILQIMQVYVNILLGRQGLCPASEGEENREEEKKEEDDGEENYYGIIVKNYYVQHCNDINTVTTGKGRILSSHRKILSKINQYATHYIISDIRHVRKHICCLAIKM